MTTSFPKTFSKIIGIFFSLMLAMLSMIQGFGTTTSGELPEIPDDFQPIVQFTVASDSHDMNDRVEAMVKQARDTVKDSNYQSIDAALIAGDFTNSGESEEIQEFYNAFTSACGNDTQPIVCLGNHELKTADVHNRYNEITGWNVDRHVVINGVHFIAISYDKTCTFDISKQLWLKEQLDEAVKDNPTMPIIVIQHPHPSATVYGSVNWGNPQLNKVLDDYPQVIDFSGHSHYPINDPRSIWQGGYTALGCGGLKYYELELNLTAGHHPDEEDSASTYWLVAVDANGSVLLKAYDVLSNSAYENTVYYLEKPTDKSSFAYTYKNMMNADKEPVFSENATVSTSVNADGETELTFSKAEDRFVVHDYTVKVKSGVIVKFDETFLSDYFYTAEPETYTVNIGKLNSGEKYSVEITAVNAYYEISEPMTYTFIA